MIIHTARKRNIFIQSDAVMMRFKPYLHHTEHCIECQNINQSLISQKTPHTSPKWASYTVLSWVVLRRQYNDVIISAIGSQITSLTIVYSSVYSGTEKLQNIKASSRWHLWGAFTVTGEFPAQMASNAEYFSIWWRHHILSSSEKIYRVILIPYCNKSDFKLRKQPTTSPPHYDVIVM